MNRFFKRSMLLGALVAACSFSSGCTNSAAEARSASAGSLALSSDDQFLYAVDTDNGVLAVIDTASEKKIAEIKVGKAPARVVVGHDDTIYVTNVEDRSVSVVRRGDWKEASRIATGVEPSGLNISPDGKTLYIVSATSLDTSEFGTLTAIDTATLQPKWELPVGAEPRGVALLNNDRAVVSLFKEGELVEVDLKTPQVVQAKVGIYQAANASKLDNKTSGTVSSFRARAIGDVVATPDGARVFAPVVWAREDSIGRRPSAAGGYYASGGPCNVGSVATAGIIAANTTGGVSPQVDDLTSCVSSGRTTGNKDYPVSSLSGRAGSPIQGPTVAAIDPTGSWLFVVNKESANVAVMPTYRRDGDDLDFKSSGSSVRSLVSVGKGADGIALTKDGTKAYVYSQFDHKVETLTANGRGTGAEVVNTFKPIQVTTDTLSPEIAAGRRLFFDAVDDRMSGSTTNVACSTCHLAGREDGHVWNFPDGPRQTPSLAGRKLFATAPYHWSGEFTSLGEFMDHTIRERMGGRGVGDKLAGQIAAYIDTIKEPENPLQKTELTGPQLAGAQAFSKAKCNSCHAGEAFTNNKNENVGTLVLTGTGNKDNGVVVTKGVNVPSLLGIARSAPYLHTGTALTLEDRINNNPNDQHGETSTLSAQEKADLVSFLKAL